MFYLLITSAFCVGFGTVLAQVGAAGNGDSAAGSLSASEGFKHAARHTAIFNWPPAHVPSAYMADGPLLGNGDLGIALGGLERSSFFTSARMISGRFLWARCA